MVGATYIQFMLFRYNRYFRKPKCIFSIKYGVCVSTDKLEND